jgi:cell division transport system permease protein
MKFFRVIGRSIRDALKSVGRNFSLSLASITCVMITLIIVGVALIVTYNVEDATKKLKKDLSIVAFVSNDADEFDIKSLETQIKGIDNVDTNNVKYQSKAEIKKEMMESNETFQNIMENWDDKENPLQDIYVVKVVDANLISETANTIKNLSKITLVKYGEGMVEQLLMAFNGVEKFSFVAVIALVVVTVFLIINTIKLTIFSRKREISIMRLVGASNSSIKLPFIFEGMFIGLIGSILPVILVIYGYFELYKILGGKLLTDIISLVAPSSIVFNIAIFIVIVGAVVGMLGSASAVRKYLKV